MKLIIQMPCYNEAGTLKLALSYLPRAIPGFDTVEWLIIDDGSSDGTADLAKSCGVDHIVRFKKNRGLARGYIAGLRASVELGADVIVNTDADNQYDASCIPDLVAPIVEGKADIVIGARPIATTRHFSPIKKILQLLGSYVVRKVSGTDVLDAPSGFRAITRDAAMRMHVFNEYTYTLETIIQAGRKNMAIVSVPIRTNEDLRPSKLVKSIPSYIKKSVMTMLRIFVVYKPFRSLMTIGSMVFGAGFLIGLRYLYYFFSGTGDGHVQSLILAAILLGMGFQTFIAAFLADLLAVNRALLEDIEYGLWKDRDSS